MLYAYVGTQTTKPDLLGRVNLAEPGIFAYVVDPSDGSMQLMQSTPQQNPTFLAISKKYGTLYAASHNKSYKDKPGSRIVAYRLDPDRGTVGYINEFVIPITHATHIILDREERYLLAACAVGGGLAVFPLSDEGALVKPSDLVMLEGRPRGPLPVLGAKISEEHRHHPPAGPKSDLPITGPHGISIDATNRVVCVPDRDRKRIWIFNLDNVNGKLVPVDPAYVDSFPDAGPRHLIFHPSGKTAYVSNEYQSSVSTYNFNSDKATLGLVDTVSTLPPEYSDRNMPSGIKILASGRFVYVANRGHDSVAILAVDPRTERLSLVGTAPLRGRVPRSITLSPEDKFLYAANEASDTVEAFRVDSATGQLTPTACEVVVRAARNIQFWENKL